jgi:hypothetical protein
MASDGDGGAFSFDAIPPAELAAGDHWPVLGVDPDGRAIREDDRFG